MEQTDKHETFTYFHWQWSIDSVERQICILMLSEEVIYSRNENLQVGKTHTHDLIQISFF